MIINKLKSGDKFQIIGNTTDFNLIRDKFSIFNELSRIRKDYRIPSRLYAITPTGMFKPGLIYEILKFAYSNGIHIDISNEVKEYISNNNISFKQCKNIQYFDYQEDCIQKLLNRNRGLCIVGTGGGKTVISAGLIESYYQYIGKNFKCLMLVDGINMVPQTIDRFKQYGCTFTYGEWDKSKNIQYNCTIINNQLATSKSKSKNNLKILLQLFKNCDLFIFDEVHHVKHGNKIGSFADKLQCIHKYGFTGTIPPNQYDKWMVNGIFGDIVFEKPSIELRNEGRLTNTEVKVFNLQYMNPPKFSFTIEQDDRGNEFLKDSTEAYDKEYDWLFENNWRNGFIAKICKNFSNNILILVNSLKHLELVYNSVKNLEGRDVYIIRGDVDKKQRIYVFNELENNDNIICIAMSTIFSTGIDISNIHMVLFAAAGKSFIRTVQSIGRGIRLNKNKNKLIVVDIADNTKYSKLHLEERLKTYNKECFPFKVFNIPVN